MQASCPSIGFRSSHLGLNKKHTKADQNDNSGPLHPEAGDIWLQGRVSGTDPQHPHPQPDLLEVVQCLPTP